MSAIHTQPIKDLTYNGIRLAIYRTLGGETMAQLTCGEVDLMSHTIQTATNDEAIAHMTAWAAQVIHFAHATQPLSNLGSTAFTMLVIAGVLLDGQAPTQKDAR